MRVNAEPDGLPVLPGVLEELWDDFRRALARRNRSESTLRIYRKSYDDFWRWATTVGITDPAEVDFRTINGWTDYLLTAPAIRNGRQVLDDAGVPRTIQPSTRRIRAPVLYLVREGVRLTASLRPG